VSTVFFAICSAIGLLSSTIQILEWWGSKPLPSLPFSQYDPLFAVSILLIPVLPVWLGIGKMRRYLQDFTVEFSGRHGTDFLVGENVRFEAKFRGDLKNGFFTCKVRPPEHAVLPDTKEDYVWWVDYNTNDYVVEKGQLHGHGSARFLGFWKVHKSVWGHKIPFEYPRGRI
jgi:hypothetical protein